MATGPIDGRLYVTDSGNGRIDVFSPWGEFVEAWGWGVADGTTEALQSCTTVCFTGLEGDGPGQFGEFPQGIAVDASGNVYVIDRANLRVEKFSSTGEFLLMFGGEVNKTAKTDVCTLADMEGGDECGAGTAGTEPGQFSAWPFLTDLIAVGPQGTVYVGDKNRVQEFQLDGSYLSQFAFAEGSPSEDLKALAVDPKSGDLYIDFRRSSAVNDYTVPNVYKLSSTGKPLATLEVAHPEALTTDVEGDLYVIENPPAGGLEEWEPYVLEYDPDGTALIPPAAAFARPSSRLGETSINAMTTNTVGDLYLTGFNGSSPFTSDISLYGLPPLALGLPPKVSPTVGAEYAVSVGSDGAELRAEVNPHFWDDATYYVQFGLSPCDEGDCKDQPAAPGAQLGSGPVNRLARTPGVFLGGLQPQTTYHYRFVAQSSGGGPVFGPDRTFTTAPLPFPPRTDCANQAFRIGEGGFLPDCRAYEMVSPPDKGNNSILNTINITGFSNTIDQSALDGDSLTYSTIGAFADSSSAPYTSQYVAVRHDGEAWSSEAIAPSRSVTVTGAKFDNEFKAFSADLTSTWVLHESDPPLAAGAIEGFANLYRREDETGAYAALTTVAPPHLEPSEYLPELQGYSADGHHTIFRAYDDLTPDAPVLGGASYYEHGQLYDASEGYLRLVAILPDGLPASKASTAGALPEMPFEGRFGNLRHAMSEDGSHVYWTEASLGAGPLYLRVHPDREQSVVAAGECTELEKACTVRVSSKPADFVAATPDGSAAIYKIPEVNSELGSLYEFQASSSESSMIAPKVLGVLGESDDLSSIYFVSEEAINGEGVADEPNLYLYTGGETRFIATLSQEDVRGNNGLQIPSVLSPNPTLHAVRVAPDGGELAFISNRPLTPYDNLDAKTGRPDSEVYIYDAASEGNGKLTCVSCLRTGARPQGSEYEPVGALEPLPSAATLPGGTSPFYASHALSSDGKRLFFESFVALVPGDTDGTEDVYEWQQVGSGECTLQSPSYSAPNDGCLALISSGKSSADSQFIDATPSGDDAFFATNESLLPQDTGLVDIYDARVDGGLPTPAPSRAACEGEACQSPPVPPIDPSLGSLSFSGEGNLAITPPARATVKRRILTRAQKLTRALHACKQKRPRRRAACRARARKRYGAPVQKSAHGSVVWKGVGAR
ncbi:MAG TPA: hypothetical protein VK781_00105 [Solirubrobacteraceae bacterium]|nr:hypothetical protein [Solirubrobacteraceae bacterium]